MLPFIAPDWDQSDRRAQMQALVAIPTLVRILYRRGGFEGLEPNQIQTLLAIELLRDPIVNDLADQLALGQVTVSNALTRLEQRGLIDTRPDPDDARRQRQRITKDGRALVRRFMTAARQRAAGGQTLS